MLVYVSWQESNQLFISGGGNFHEFSFDEVIVLIQPWCNFSQMVTDNVQDADRTIMTE